MTSSNTLTGDANAELRRQAQLVTCEERRFSEFATLAHANAGHVRRYTNGQPYIVHPAAVAAIVRSIPHSLAMLGAAWLHDVVEDAGVQIDEIARLFGHDVAELVLQITPISRASDGPRAIRKAIDRANLAKASPAAKTVALADAIDNLSTIRERAPRFAPVYLAEKRLLLPLLVEGDPTLFSRAMALAQEPPRGS